MTVARRLAVAAALLAFAASACAADGAVRLRVCMGDVDYPPYSIREGGGRFQYLLRQAAPAANVQLEWHWMPIRRCNELLRTGGMDATFSAFYPEVASDAVFPMREGRPDDNLALSRVRMMLCRRTGSALQWDGERIRGIGPGAIGVNAGFAVVTSKLDHLGMRYDDGAKSLESNLEKLVRGRLEAVVALEPDARELVAKQFAGKADILPKPFVSLDAYLVFSKPYHALHADLAQNYWQAIQRIRDGAGYRQFLADRP